MSMTMLSLYLTIGAAQAASGVTARFDGMYSGMAEPAANRASAHCAPFTVEQVSITKGQLKSPSGPASPRLKGFITEEGYVSASMARPNMKELALDGRLQGDTIVAGYVDEGQNCNWVVKLKKQP
jgi:hypothetical protein